MPPAHRVPEWYQNDGTPHWARVLYRNTQGYSRWLFKKPGLKSFRGITWLIGTHPRLSNMGRRLRLNWAYVSHRFTDIETSTLLEENPFAATYSVVHGFWSRFWAGRAMLEEAGKLYQTRMSGFTSQGESEMNKRAKTWRLDDHKYTMSIDQSKQILDISAHNFYPRVVDRNFSRMFLANQISNGGSWYLISRIYCAKRVLDREMHSLGIRDPPHLRPDEDERQRNPDPIRPDDPVFNQRMAKEAYDDSQNTPRRPFVGSNRRSTVDPTHGSRHGFSSFNKNSANSRQNEQFDV